MIEVVRGLCSKCGGSGHFSFQCRNFLKSKGESSLDVLSTSSDSLSSMSSECESAESSDLEGTNYDANVASGEDKALEKDRYGNCDKKTRTSRDRYNNQGIYRDQGHSKCAERKRDRDRDRSKYTHKNRDRDRGHFKEKNRDKDRESLKRAKKDRDRCKYSSKDIDKGKYRGKDRYEPEERARKKKRRS